MARGYNSMVPQSRARRACICTLPSIFRLFLVLFITTFVAIISILVHNSPPFPGSYNDVAIDWNWDPVQDGHYLPFDKGFVYNTVLQAHAHTIVSDGRMTPEQLVQYHIANGFNVLAVTDHNSIDGGLQAQKIVQANPKYSSKISIIVGEEWTNCRVHMGFLGISTMVPAIKYPTDDEIKQAIDNVHAQGGLVIYNHIPWSTWAGLNQPSKEQLMAWGVDYFDVTTGNILDLQTLYWARNNGFGTVAAGDIHTGGPVNAWTLVNVPGYGNSSAGVVPNPQDVMNALKNMRTTSTSFLFDAIGSPYSVSGTITTNPVYTFATPWLLVGDIFTSFYTVTRGGPYSFVNGYCGTDTITVDHKSILATFGWFFMLFIFLEFVRYGVGLLSERICPGFLTLITGRKPVVQDTENLTPLMDIWK